MAIFAIDPSDGALQGPTAFWQAEGQGPDLDRQKEPHPHWVGFDAAGGTLYCVDLGTDRITAFDFDPAIGAIGEALTAYAAPAGSGPRHLLLHPHLPLAYLVSEMAATLTVLHRESALFARGVTVPTLAEAHPGNIAGGMARNRATDRLYVTNRGADSVAVFALDAHGNPAALGEVASGGRSPRFVLVLDDQARLLVAHEGGEAVTAFTILADGMLAHPVAIAIPGAAFIAPASG